MMRALFSSRKGKKAETFGLEHKRNQNELVAESSMNKSKRELYKFELPSDQQDLSDLINAHKPGNRFQYIALSGKEEESHASRIRRLVTLTPKYGKEILPTHKVPIIKLIKESEQFNLGQIVSKKGKPYIRLSSVTGVYVPLVSSTSDFTTVMFSLHDTRLLRDSCVQSVKYNSNLTEKIELSLDYCIPRTSAYRIMLNISREQNFLEEGEEWGTVQLQIKLEESDFPYSNNLKDAAAILAMPPSLLDTHVSNPNHVDTTVTESSRKKVVEIYEDGDIVDENEPITEHMKPITYAKSSIAPKIKGPKTGKKFGKGWEHIEIRKPLVVEEQISEEQRSESPSIDVEEFLKLSEEYAEASGIKRKEDSSDDAGEKIREDVTPAKIPEDPKTFLEESAKKAVKKGKEKIAEGKEKKRSGKGVQFLELDI